MFSPQTKTPPHGENGPGRIRTRICDCDRVPRSHYATRPECSAPETRAGSQGYASQFVRVSSKTGNDLTADKAPDHPLTCMQHGVRYSSIKTMRQRSLTMFALLVTILVALSPGQKADKNKPKHKATAVLFDTVTIHDGRRCITYRGLFVDDYFLDVEVRSTKHGVEMRKDSQPVTNFPPTTNVVVHVVTGECNPNVIQLGPAGDHEHISGLGFDLSWLRGRDILPIKDVTSHYSRSPAWLESENPWGEYQISIPSQGVPISDTLRVCISEADKEQACLKGNLKTSIWLHL